MFTSTKSIGKGVRQNTGTFIEHIPTSGLFGAILTGAPQDRVMLAWLLGSLGQRSFGMVMLLLGLVAMVPGVSIIAGLLLAGIGSQMIMGREAVILPRFIAARSLSTRRIARLVRRSIPAMKLLERVIRPRWHTPFIATKRVVGLIVLMLATTIFMPIPLSNIIPGAMTMLVAFAYLEEDGVLLCIALSASFGSLAITVVEIWATLRGADFLLGL
jgi:hypothetical protein